MFLALAHQFKKFSYENWWIYVLLLLALSVTVITGKGHIFEIIGIFFLNLTAATCNMLMMSSYKEGKYAEGSVFILLANCLYTFLSLYAWIIDGDMQYIYWQLSFLLTGMHAFMYYNFQYNIKYINYFTIFVLNSLVIFALYSYVQVSFEVLIQSLGIFSVTLGLILKDDIKRYFYIFIGNSFIVLGSLLILWNDYVGGDILGVTVAYTLLGLSIAVYNYKILPVYLKRAKLF